MPTTLAECILLAALLWVLDYLMKPLRRPIERWVLRLLAPHRASIFDVEIVKKNKSEEH